MYLNLGSTRAASDLAKISMKSCSVKPKTSFTGLIFAVHGTAECTGIVSIQAETQTQPPGEFNGMFTYSSLLRCEDACRAEFKVDAFRANVFDQAAVPKNKGGVTQTIKKTVLKG